MPDAPTKWLYDALARYERPLIRYALTITGDLEHARDVVQETFVRLSREHDVADRVAAWLFTTCRHYALDVCRKNNRIVAMQPEEMNNHASEDLQPSAELERKETAARLGELVGALPVNQREVIRLKFDAGLSYREISEVTKLSVGNVGFLIHTAVKSLRDSWQQEAIL